MQVGRLLCVSRCEYPQHHHSKNRHHPTLSLALAIYLNLYPLTPTPIITIIITTAPTLLPSLHAGLGQARWRRLSRCQGCSRWRAQCTGEAPTRQGT